MKKIVSGMMLVLVAFFLVACGAKEETKSFTMNQAGIEMVLTYTYEGDTVTKQVTTSKIEYKALGIETKEQAKTILDEQSKKFQNIDGLEEKIEYSDTYATETVAVDYSKVDLSKLGDLPGTSGNADAKSKKISMKESEKILNCGLARLG